MDKFSFKNREARKGWKKTVRANQDPYGLTGVSYAARWAALMEQKMKQGFTVEEIAEETSRAADTEGITGFMYGCAVSILAQTWKHGEELRRWHNLDVQIGDEGKRANEEGGTLNPAMMTIQKA